MDQDLFRNILFEVEKIAPNQMLIGRDFIQKFQSEYGGDFVDDYIIEHLRIAEEADFIDAGFSELGSGKMLFNYVSRLTYDGHQYLGKIRDETTWNNVKKQIQEKGLSVSVDIIREAAEKYIQNKLGE